MSWPHNEYKQSLTFAPSCGMYLASRAERSPCSVRTYVLKAQCIRRSLLRTKATFSNSLLRTDLF